MCDPLTIAGAALLAGSTVANQIGANRVARARDNAMAAERIRQGGLDDQAFALNEQSQDRYQDFGDQQADRAGELGQYFTDQQIEADNNASAVAEQVIPQSGSNVVVAEEAKKRGEARAYANQQGEALGNLRSFGDLLGGIGREQARDAGQIGQIAGFKRGSANVLPFELEAANSAGSTAQMFGDILGLGGSVALGAGLSAGAPAAADPWAGMRSVGKMGGNGFDWNMLARGGPGAGANAYNPFR